MGGLLDAARALGFLEGMSAVVWSAVEGERPVRIGSEMAARYEECVEELRKAVDWGGDGDAGTA